VSLLIAFMATSLSFAADSSTELRNLGDSARSIRVTVPVGDVTVTRDASLTDIELRTTPINWDSTCELEVLGALRARVQVKRPVLPRHECAMSIDLRLPPGVALTVNLDDGDAALNGLVSDARINLGEGNLSLTDVRSELTVRMGNGQITGTHSSQMVDMTLTNEKVTLDGVSQIAADTADSADSADGDRVSEEL